MTYTTTLNVSYGIDPAQFVNLYTPSGTPLGTILHIHGGGWIANNSTTGPSPTATDPTMVQFVSAGYAVIDMQYRDRASGGGTTVTNHIPGDVSDVVTVLSYCLDSVAAANKGGQWPTIQNYISNNQGLVVGGTSAGGHLTIMGVCTYGTSSGLWPKGAISISGPTDIDYFTTSTNFIDPYIRNSFVDQYIQTMLESDQKLASPFWQYGSQVGEGGAPSPGPWFNAVNSSNCKFVFVQNENDTLVTLHNVAPAVDSFSQYNTNTAVVRVVEGPPLGDWDTFNPISIKSTLSSTSQLPNTGQTLGDSYILPNGVWVYNNGTYTGDNTYPASVNGFTLWFQHNYTIGEYPRILDIANDVFKNLQLSPAPGNLTGIYGSPIIESDLGQTFSVSGGTGPYSYEIADGVIPPGLSLISFPNNPNNGLLTGIPTVPGLYNFKIRATDANGATVTGDYQVMFSTSTVTYNSKLLPQGQDSVFTGFRYPRNFWHSQYSSGVGGLFNANISDSVNAISDFTSTHAYVVDEIHWGTGKPTGDDLQALCDYWRYYGISPGVGITHAAETGYGGITPVPTATILADAIRADWVALDPYLYIASIPGFNNGDTTINQSNITNTINGLIAWTQGWINRLAPYGIPVVLITQGIRELGMSESYVDQYLQAQYTTFNSYKTPLRLVFPYEVLIGLSVYEFANVDVSSYVLAHPLAKTNQKYPRLVDARPKKGQTYPRFKITNR
jgi:acetyl esterase/lipase